MTTQEIMDSIRWSLDNAYNLYRLKDGRVGWGDTSESGDESTFEIFTGNRKFTVTIVDSGPYQRDYAGL